MTERGRPADHAFPWRRVIGVIAAMTVLAFLLWNVISHFGETEIVPRPTVVPTLGPEATTLPTERPSTPTDTATPDTGDDPAWEAGTLPAMLNQAPDLLADGSLPLNDIARYSDIAAWTSALGLETPSSAETASASWMDALDALALPTSLSEFGLDPRWKQTYGFDLTQVQQVLVVGQAPDVVLLMRGDFDPDALMASWVASGYQPVEVEGETVWTLSPADGIDLAAPESRLSLGSLNNVVILDDGTLATSSRLARLGTVLQVEHGDAESLAVNDDIAPLLTPGSGVDDLDSAILSRGTLLQAPPGTKPDVGTPVAAPRQATPVARAAEPVTPAMGEVAVVLIGIGPPVDGVAPFTLRVVLNDEDDAQATAAMVEQRLVSSVSSVDGEPYQAVLGKTVITEDDRVVMIDAARPPDDFDWLRLVSDRDLGFAWWSPEP